MAMRQPRARILEEGNLAFSYRPVVGVGHPRNSDEIQQVAWLLFPDDQQRGRNRRLIFPRGFFPPVVPGQVLPQERGWAFVDAVNADARGLIDALEAAQAGRPAARIAGLARYALARRGDQTDFSYVLHQPRSLGPAQQTTLIDPKARYQVVVKQPSMPSPLGLVVQPAYPASLGAAFDGHVSIPLDPPDFLDYPWTQLYFFDGAAGLAAEVAQALQPATENDATRDAFAALHDQAKQIRADSGVEILKPLRDGGLE